MKDLDGRTVFVTGANTGIGRVTAMRLAARGARTWLAGRSEERTRPVLESIRESGGSAEFLPLDLADLVSVRACAERFLALDEPLHVLINNAGLAGRRGQTVQGFELTFGVNHLGHFLLTQLLVDRLKQSGAARIVNVASRAHRRARKPEWRELQAPTRSFSGVPEYAWSKLCNILHAKALSRRLAGSGITTYALHPGVVASDIWRRIPWPARRLATAFMISEEEGAETSIHCAASPDTEGESGLYYDKSEPVTPSQLAQDAELAEELWEQSELWVV